MSTNYLEMAKNYLEHEQARAQNDESRYLQFAQVAVAIAMTQAAEQEAAALEQIARQRIAESIKNIRVSSDDKDTLIIEDSGTFRYPSGVCPETRLHIKSNSEITAGGDIKIRTLFNEILSHYEKIGNAGCQCYDTPVHPETDDEIVKWQARLDALLPATIADCIRVGPDGNVGIGE